MANSIAGYTKKLQLKTTGGSTYHDLPATSSNLNLAGEMLDDTTFNTTAYRSRCRGLLDYSISAPSMYSSTDIAIALARDALLAGSALDVRYLANGVAGYQGRVIVETFSQSGDVGGLETVDISLQATGSVALTTV